VSEPTICEYCERPEATHKPLFDPLPTLCYRKVDGRSRRAEVRCYMRTIAKLRARVQELRHPFVTAQGAPEIDTRGPREYPGEQHRD
jgi:hypothetical protein